MAKKAKVYRSPYLAVEADPHGYGVVYTMTGDYSVFFKMSNPILRWSGDHTEYEEFHAFFVNLLKLLGEGYILQKQDLFFRKKYSHKMTNTDFLDNEYFQLFEGRVYTETETYLIVTKEAKRGLYTYDPNAWEDFHQNISRMRQMFDAKGYSFHPMTVDEDKRYLHQYFTASFGTEGVNIDNFKATRRKFFIGDREVRVMSLVDIDTVDLPATVRPFRKEQMGEFNFPVDLFSFLPDVPEVDTLIYNQIMQIPNQEGVKARLMTKYKRHSSVPDAANYTSMQDIDQMLAEMSRNSKMVINTHYGFTLVGKGNLENAVNYLSGLFNSRCSIYPSRQCYNQFPLFEACMPGNTKRLKDYDLFLIPADAAVCFLYKETRQQDEISSFLTWFCDRQGVPLAIDPFSNIIASQRCKNANKFVLGPSGSGKSFFVNEYVRQIYRNGVEVVLVDTGHSYSGLCEYVGGRYITYTDENPITMNPFRISREEYNEEKREFLKSLITLLWKGADGSLTTVEDTLISNTVNEYYRQYFAKLTVVELRNKARLEGWSDETLQEKLGPLRDMEVAEDFGPSYLSFNSFYEFSGPFMNKQIEEAKISAYAEMESYEFVLRKFYRGGDYDRTLNDDMDRSLFDERLIIFEVDAIKDHKILFPIVTLIIMDLFIQKMRLKMGGKSLIIEEAWKAIASPTMASYLVYLYKTVRKFNGEAIVVTQELKDLIGNEIVKNSIVANSDTVILLDQGENKKNFDEVRNILGISPTEEAKIFSINQMKNTRGRRKFNEVYIRRGSSGEVYGTEVSAAQYYTYTTTRVEKDAVRKFHDAYAKVDEERRSEWIGIRTHGAQDISREEYRELCQEWRSHFDLYRIALTAYIREQRKSDLSDQLFAEQVGQEKYKVPVDRSVYERLDF